MKIKTKLIASIMSICLVCAVFAIGVFALRTANLKIGGNVAFTATGVEATISNAAMKNGIDGTNVMELPTGFETGGKIDTSMTQTHIDGLFSKWDELTFTFDAEATDITYSFDVRNDADATTEKNNYIEIDYSYSFSGEAKNVDVFAVSTNDYILAPGDTKSFGIIVRVLNKELDISQTSLTINVSLKHRTPKVATATNNVVTIDKVQYTLNEQNKTATITGHTISDSDQNVSAVIHPIVMADKEGAVPCVVTEIGNEAFFKFKSNELGVAGLTEISIPNSIAYIRDSAFSNTGLKTIEIPVSVKDMGQYVFFTCSELVSVRILANNLGMAPSIFFGCTKLSTIKIPNGCTAIAWSAFENCTSLTAVTIPASVQNIWYGSFKGCTNLASIKFEDPDEWYADETYTTPANFTAVHSQQNYDMLVADLSTNYYKKVTN